MHHPTLPWPRDGYLYILFPVSSHKLKFLTLLYLHFQPSPVCYFSHFSNPPTLQCHEYSTQNISSKRSLSCCAPPPGSGDLLPCHVRSTCPNSQGRGGRPKGWPSTTRPETASACPQSQTTHTIPERLPSCLRIC